MLRVKKLHQTVIAIFTIHVGIGMPAIDIRSRDISWPKWPLDKALMWTIRNHPAPKSTRNNLPLTARASSDHSSTCNAVWDLDATGDTMRISRDRSSRLGVAVDFSSGRQVLELLSRVRLVGLFQSWLRYV